ncbi:MAG: flavodoxin family protein, partial [Oscillospiraceae bacterium]
MKYSIVYTSQTGNTAMLAQHLKESIANSGLIYYGTPNMCAQEADMLFVGFWTDKGSCDKPTS